MKTECDKCGARYRIPEEKLEGKLLRIRCRKCDHIFTVRDALAAPSDESLAQVSRKTGALSTLGGSDLTRDWYYAVNGESFGPYAASELSERFENAQLGADAHVWKQGLAAWVPAMQVPDFAAAIEQAQTNLPGFSLPFAPKPSNRRVSEGSGRFTVEVRHPGAAMETSRLGAQEELDIDDAFASAFGERGRATTQTAPHRRSAALGRTEAPVVDTLAEQIRQATAAKKDTGKSSTIASLAAAAREPRSTARSALGSSDDSEDPSPKTSPRSPARPLPSARKETLISGERTAVKAANARRSLLPSSDPLEHEATDPSVVIGKLPRRTTPAPSLSERLRQIRESQANAAGAPTSATARPSAKPAAATAPASAPATARAIAKAPARPSPTSAAAIPDAKLPSGIRDHVKAQLTLNDDEETFTGQPVSPEERFASAIAKERAIAQRNATQEIAIDDFIDEISDLLHLRPGTSRGAQGATPADAITPSAGLPALAEPVIAKELQTVVVEPQAREPSARAPSFTSEHTAATPRPDSTTARKSLIDPNAGTTQRRAADALAGADALHSAPTAAPHADDRTPEESSSDALPESLTERVLRTARRAKLGEKVRALRPKRARDHKVFAAVILLLMACAVGLLLLINARTEARRVAAAEAELLRAEMEAEQLEEARRLEQESFILARNRAASVVALAVGRAERQARAAGQDMALGNASLSRQQRAQTRAQRAQRAPQAPPAANATFASTQVTPTLTESTSTRSSSRSSVPSSHFAETLRGAVRSSVGRCAQRARALTGGLNVSRVELQITIRADGTVDRIGAQRALRDSPFMNCMSTESSRWKFASFEGNRTTIEHSFVVQ